MKVTVNIGFYTDGDFCFDYDGFKRDIDDLPEYNEICSSLDKIDLNEEDFSLEVSFTNKSLQKVCTNADTLLSSVLTNIRVLYTHYGLLEDLYNLFDGAIRAVYAGEDYLDKIFGNYDGTFVEVIFDRENKDE